MALITEGEFSAVISEGYSFVGSSRSTIPQVDESYVVHISCVIEQKQSSIVVDS
jgi:hypothetical protein